MTDYNDGKIHGWNGGECPVHPKTVVEVREWNGLKWTADADICDWLSMRGAFRVVRAYREPREFWVADAGHSYVQVRESCEGAFKVREVLE